MVKLSHGNNRKHMDSLKDILYKTKEKKPAYVSPMLAKLTEKRFSSPDWIFEKKFDGERCVAVIIKGKVTLYSRNHNAINISYPEIVSGLEKAAKHDVVLDGEVVAFHGDMGTFERLAERMHVKSPAKAKSRFKVRYYLFDIINFDGWDMRRLNVLERKKVLKSAVKFNESVLYAAHYDEDGAKYHAQACRRGWEGLIAKRIGSEYVSKRSSDWLKFKCVNEDEYVIAGYTDPRGSRKAFGALLIGYYRKGKLRYAGKVGSGYDEKELADMKRRMDKLKAKASPFSDFAGESDCHFIKPRLVGQFAFTEKLRTGKLRHPRFLGLRRDKAAKEVTY